MAPKKKKDARARSKSHKKPTPAAAAAACGPPSREPPTATTSPPLPSPHPSTPPLPPAMLPSSSTKKTDTLPPLAFHDPTTILESLPPLAFPTPSGLRLSLPTEETGPFPLSSLTSAGPSSSTGETHQEPRACGGSGETFLSPPPPPSDDKPYDPAKPSMYPWASESSVRTDGAAENAALDRAGRAEPSTSLSSRPSAKQRASRRKAARPPTGKQTARRRPSINQDLEQLLVPAAASSMFAVARYDFEKDADTLPDRLLETVGLVLPHLSEVVEALQELAVEKGDEAEKDAAAKASEEMKTIASMYGAASKVLAEKVKRDAGHSSGNCKEEGSGTSAAAGRPDDDDDGGQGDGLRA